MRDKVTAMAWANAQQVSLGTDSDGSGYIEPPGLETEYEFVPRTDGVAMLAPGKEGQINVGLWRVNCVASASVRQPKKQSALGSITMFAGG